MDKQLISQEDTFVWLSRGGLKRQNGSEIIAAQDQVLQTKISCAKFLQPKYRANADSRNNFMRQ